MKQYYLHNGQDYEGPFNKEELKLKKITNDTPIWSEDMVNWKKAEEINELKNSITTIPPLLKTRHLNLKNLKVLF